jgi:hypothetical protein
MNSAPSSARNSTSSWVTAMLPFTLGCRCLASVSSAIENKIGTTVKLGLSAALMLLTGSEGKALLREHTVAKLRFPNPNY